MENVIIQADCEEVRRGESYKGQILLDDVKLNFSLEFAETGLNDDLTASVSEVKFSNSSGDNLDTSVSPSLRQELEAIVRDVSVSHFELINGRVKDACSAAAVDPRLTEVLGEHVDPAALQAELTRVLAGAISIEREPVMLPRTPDLDSLMQAALTE